MRIAVACPLLLGLLTALPASAQALYAGNTVAYQGRLELDGQAVNDTVSMTFRFYASEGSTTQLGSFTTDVTPAGGAFALKIGPLPDAVFAAPDLWLAVEVDGAALGGRQRVIPSARAARADTAGELTVTGTAVVVGNTESNNLEIGHMGHGGWAGVAHTDTANTTGYALLQNANGSETLVNAAPGGQVKIRTGNVDRVTVSSSGHLSVSGGATVTGNVGVSGDLDVGPATIPTASSTATARARTTSASSRVGPTSPRPTTSAASISSCSRCARAAPSTRTRGASPAFKRSRRASAFSTPTPTPWWTAARSTSSARGWGTEP